MPIYASPEWINRFSSIQEIESFDKNLAGVEQPVIINIPKGAPILDFYKTSNGYQARSRI